MNEQLSDEERAQLEELIAGAQKDQVRKKERSALPVITMRAGELHNVATDGENALLDAEAEIYQRGGELVRPVFERVETARKQKATVVQLKTMDAIGVRDELALAARWERLDARAKKCVPCDPSREVAEVIKSRYGKWLFRRLAGIITTPTMRADGSLITQPGYDGETQLLLINVPLMPPLPDRPSREDALAALGLFDELLIGFPFVDAVDRAVALSTILTVIARGAFSVAPMHCFRAPTAGTGKSFLLDVVAAIASGQIMPIVSTGKSEEELEKRLGSMLMRGQTLCSIDNVNGELGGDALCQFIERPSVNVRVLGHSKMVLVEGRSISLFATGNNLVLKGDVCRRALIGNLDAKVERPELRQFHFDPVERVLADRGRYIAAALTICRAYFMAGRPNLRPKLASFEGWSDTVRSALVWLGCDDPCVSQEMAREEDPDLAELREMLAAWNAEIGSGYNTKLKTKDVILRGESADSTGEPTYPQLHGALESIALSASTGRSKQADPKTLGEWLRSKQGRIADGMKFSFKHNSKTGNHWYVEKV